MIKRALPLLLLALLALPAVAHAQDPDDPFDVTPVPTSSLDITPAPAPELVPTGTLTLTLDAGLWDYDTFIAFQDTSYTVLSIADQYKVISLLVGVVLAAGVLRAMIGFLTSRSDG